MRRIIKKKLFQNVPSHSRGKTDQSLRRIQHSSHPLTTLPPASKDKPNYSQNGSKGGAIKYPTACHYKEDPRLCLEPLKHPWREPKILQKACACFNLCRKEKDVMLGKFSEKKAQFWIKMKSFYYSRDLKGYHNIKHPDD